MESLRINLFEYMYSRIVGIAPPEAGRDQGAVH